MTGICGFIGIDDKNLLKKMGYVIRHRGDNHEYYVDDDIGICVRWFSDEKPNLNKDGDVILAFDGEFFFIDVDELVSLYKQKGVSCLNNVNGAFAFSLWDSHEKKLILGRDKTGQRIIYYALLGDKLIFSSEIKAILLYEKLRKSINLHALGHYLAYGYVVTEDTLFRYVNKILPATVSIFTLGENRIIRETVRYWDIPTKINHHHSNLDELTDEMYKNIAGAVGIRADKKPTGVLLSGGLDSSIITAMLRRSANLDMKGYTVIYENVEPEPFSRIVADFLGIDLREVSLSKRDAIKSLTKLVQTYDDLIGEIPAGLATFKALEKASSEVRVVFTGDGGDEIFWGYPWVYGNIRDACRYHKLASLIPSAVKKDMLHLLNHIPINKGLRGLRRSLSTSSYEHLLLLKFYSPSPEDYKQILPHVQSKPEVDILEVLNRYPRVDELTTAYLALWNIYMGFNAIRPLLISSALGLDSKLPFFDSRLAEFTYSIPQVLKQRGFSTKLSLKRMIMRYALLPKVVTLRPKRGFTDDVSWLGGELREYATNFLTENIYWFKSILNTEYILRNINREEPRWRNGIFLLLLLALWYKNYILGERID